MTIQGAKFKTIDVRRFLSNKAFPFAAQSFAEKFVNQEEVAVSVVENWFRGYFPSETAFREFRQLECFAIQYIPFESEEV